MPNAYGDQRRAADLTAEAIAEGATCLFEATAEHEGLVARLDVLQRNPLGWTIHEVKSSSLKPAENLRSDLVQELAFEVLTARRAGLNVTEACLVLVNTKYAWPGGEPDPFAMLGTVDLTAECEDLADEVAERAETICVALTDDQAPAVETNVHCKRCDYFEHCLGPRDPQSILFLHRVKAPQVTELRERRVQRIADIPEDFPLTEPQARQRRAFVDGAPVVGEGLADALAAIRFPAAFVDFETTNPAFPIVVGTRPYAQTCFQWSSHTLDGPDGPPSHREYLADAQGDPREPFCRSLWKAVKGARSIVHYTGFEVERVREMAEDGVPFADGILAAFEERTVDLHAIVAEHLTMKEFEGRTSIKVVLPALVPTMSYAGMPIAEGAAAALAFLRIRDASTPPEERQRLRRDLLAYCRQDTLAMVEIYRALRAHVGQGSPA